MKRTSRKLALGRETIRRLTGDEQLAIRGGLPTDSNSCVTCGANCQGTSQAALCTNVVYCANTGACGTTFATVGGTC